MSTSWFRAAGWFCSGLCSGTLAGAETPAGITLTNARDPGAPLLLKNPAALTDALRHWQNQPDTDVNRSAVADAVLAHYQAAGWPVTEVSVLPAGDGQLEIQVREGRYGSIAVDGGTAGMRQAIAASWQKRPGAPLTLADVEAALAWTHRNPLHAVTASFSPGPGPATADTVLTIQSETPARCFGGWRNDGVASLGEDRFSAGVEFADPAGLPLWATAEILSGTDPGAYLAARSSLRLFLPWEQELRLSGQWTRGRSDGVVPGFTSSSDVEAWFAGGRYLIPLPAWKGWQADLGGGADFFRTTSGVSVEDLSVTGTADALQFTLEANASRHAGPHNSGFHLEAVWSPGGVTHQANDAAHSALRTGASADYYLGRLQAWHRYEFTSAWSLTGQTGGQWSSAPVLPMQAFSPAGANAVRGFPEASVLGDNGGWAGIEAAAPALRPLPSVPAFSAQPVFFLEGALVRDTVSGDNSTIASAGTGLRLRWRNHVQLAADYGWRLTEPGSRAHLSVRLEF